MSSLKSNFERSLSTTGLVTAMLCTFSQVEEGAAPGQFP